jgi:hypothetical protein
MSAPRLIDDSRMDEEHLFSRQVSHFFASSLSAGR